MIHLIGSLLRQTLQHNQSEFTANEQLNLMHWDYVSSPAFSQLLTSAYPLLADTCQQLELRLMEPIRLLVPKVYRYRLREYQQDDYDQEPNTEMDENLSHMLHLLVRLETITMLFERQRLLQNRDTYWLRPDNNGMLKQPVTRDVIYALFKLDTSHPAEREQFLHQFYSESQLAEGLQAATAAKQTQQQLKISIRERNYANELHSRLDKIVYEFNGTAINAIDFYELLTSNKYRMITANVRSPQRAWMVNPFPPHGWEECYRVSPTLLKWVRWNNGEILSFELRDAEDYIVWREAHAHDVIQDPFHIHAQLDLLYMKQGQLQLAFKKLNRGVRSTDSDEAWQATDTLWLQNQRVIAELTSWLPNGGANAP